MWPRHPNQCERYELRKNLDDVFGAAFAHDTTRFKGEICERVMACQDTDSKHPQPEDYVANAGCVLETLPYDFTFSKQSSNLLLSGEHRKQILWTTK